MNEEINLQFDETKSITVLPLTSVRLNDKKWLNINIKNSVLQGA